MSRTRSDTPDRSGRLEPDLSLYDDGAIPKPHLVGHPEERPAHNPKVAGSNPAPATMNDEGLVDAATASPFRLPRLHPGKLLRDGGATLASSGIEPVADKPISMPLRTG